MSNYNKIKEQLDQRRRKKRGRKKRGRKKGRKKKKSLKANKQVGKSGETAPVWIVESIACRLYVKSFIVANTKGQTGDWHVISEVNIYNSRQHRAKLRQKAALPCSI